MKDKQPVENQRFSRLSDAQLLKEAGLEGESFEMLDCMEIGYFEEDVLKALRKLSVKRKLWEQARKEIENLRESKDQIIRKLTSEKEELKDFIKDIVHRGRIHSDKLTQQLNKANKELEKRR